MAKNAAIIDTDGSESDIYVGKDVLELLSSSMYVDPLSIFREYIQNATDAIDEAFKSGVLNSIVEGMIEINLDHVNRRILIRDNGIGLSNRKFSKRMLSFGASEKRGTEARGFRGVGRLSGLGYAQNLVFRSRSNGDKKVREASWDGLVVKQMLADNDSSMDLRDIVRESITIRNLDPEGHPDHFFEVEMIRPRRISNDKLLNEVEIENYISQICPCPFAPEFSYGEKINSELVSFGKAGNSYNIHINSSEYPIYRPYRDFIEYSDDRKAMLTELKIFEIYGTDGGVAAICWLIHHDYQGAIPVSQGVRGLRARVGNIQVGHDRLFSQIFPEDRFSSWTIGEVHVLDTRVVPNGRRDNFENNVHFDNIILHLRPVGSEVARQCRISSQKRNRFKLFDVAESKALEILQIINQGAVSNNFSKAIECEMEIHLENMRKVMDWALFDESDNGELRIRYDRLNTEVKKCSMKPMGNFMSRLPKHKRATYREMFDLIYEVSSNQNSAKELIDRIIDRISRS